MTNCFGVDSGFNMNGMEPSAFARYPNLADVRAVMDEMNKAMTATPGAVPNYSGVGSAAPLFKQEIVDQLFMQVVTQDQVKFFPTVYKNSSPSKNTIVEYTKQTGIGSEFADIFQAEGSAGQYIDSEFARAYEKMRWISEKRNVSLQASLVADPVGNIGGVVAKAMTDANTHILNRLEHAMFYGDSSINVNSIDGLNSIIRQNNASWQTIDKRNTSLLLADVGDGQVAVYDNVYGRIPGTMWTAPGVAQTLAEEHGDRVKAFYGPGQTPPDTAGNAARTFLTQLGKVDVNYSFYLSPLRKKLAHVAATHTTAPATPTLTSAVAGADAASKFAAADAADYVYKIVAVGNVDALGASAPVASPSTAVAAGEAVTLTIASTGNTNVNFYNIYRHVKGSSTWYLIGQVKCAGGSTATTFIDYNEEIPGTADAFLLQQNNEILQWREMMPYSMIRLPAIDFYQPYAFAMFGTVICPVPAMIRFKNIAV